MYNNDEFSKPDDFDSGKAPASDNSFEVGFESNNSSGLSSGQGFEPQKPRDSSHFKPSSDTKWEVSSSEYRYKQEDIPKDNYSDARYTSASEIKNIPQRRYYYHSPEVTKKPKRDSRGLRFPQIIAMCLVCAVLGGVGGSVIGASLLGNGTSPSSPAAAIVTPAINTPNPVNTPAVSNVKASAGMTGAEIYEMACPQVVGITTDVVMYNYFGQPSTTPVSGSGFIIRSDGYIVTNYHVIENAVVSGYEVMVHLYGGESHPATIVGYEPANDVAVLKIDAENLSAAALSDSDHMRVGESLYAVGNPLGELSYTMTSGMLSALDREIQTDANTKINMFQFDAAVNSGNSGGPVYNSNGEVVGIVTAKYSSTGVEGLGFAIPINDALLIINELIENGYVSGKASLDVSVRTTEQTFVEYYNTPQGVYVMEVQQGGAADNAGIKIGDIIIKLNDTDIPSYNELRSAIRNFKAGDSAVITVYRGGENIELSVTFSESKPQVQQPQSNQPQQAPQQQGSYQIPSGGSFPFSFGY